ncbi:O-antigen ligase family protein [Marinobacter arenosus]|uniref:O-antigen ligase family protein n=1 Tax=Marinobacter arenosus TaxID=2856822 RepID=UPI001C4D8A90|nr:O-antigen ligase family protein [Marinobacter arenosus]MBW0146846.1 O-antigen ligase family protein [Marinobacter arenosus]
MISKVYANLLIARSPLMNSPGFRSALLFGVFPFLLLVSGLFSQFFLAVFSSYALGVVAASIELIAVAFWLTNGPTFTLMKSRAFRIGAGIWVVVGFLSAVLAQYNVTAAIFAQLQWLLHLLFVLALVDLFRKTEEAFLPMQWAVIATSLAVVGFYLSLWFSLESPESFDWFGSPIPFPHIRHFGYIAALACLVAGVHYYESGLKQVGGAISLGVVVVLFAALVWAGGRASIGAVLVGWGVFAVYSLRAGIPWARIGMLAVAMFAGLLLSNLFAVDDERMGLSMAHGKEVSELSVNQFTSGRLEIWRRSIENVIEYSIPFGVGPSNFRYAPSSFSGTEQAHSVIFQSISDWGVLGGSVFLGFLVFLVWLVLKSLIKRGEAAGGFKLGVAIASVSGYLFLGLFDGNFYYSWSLLLVLPAAAWMLSRELKCTESQAVEAPVSERSPMKAAAGVSFAVCLLATLILGVNATTVFSKPEPEVRSWQSELVLTFPVITMNVDQWLKPWLKADTQQGLRLLGWLKRYHREGYKFYLVEAEMLDQIGKPTLAKKTAQQAYDLAGPYNHSRVTDMLMDGGFEKWIQSPGVVK